jgi:hypothetical protein
LADGALTDDEAEEIEEEREIRDESETIDSGEDAVETEFASDERRVKWLIGDEIAEGGHRSRDWVAMVHEACAMAKPIEEPFPRRQEAALTAGVLNPLV